MPGVQCPVGEVKAQGTVLGYQAFQLGAMRGQGSM